jgi:hypothetical protein
MREADQEPVPPADSIEGEPQEGGTEATPSPARMVRLEQQLGWLVVAAAATAIVGSWAHQILHGDNQALGKAAVGLGLAGVLAGAVWYGRRLIAAFAAMAAGLAPVDQKSGYALISIVCLAYGGVLLFRNTLAQRKLAMARPRRPPKSARTRSSKAAEVVADSARRPSANRRYTPPKAKNPRRGR